MDSNIGKMLDGRYELLELIGTGGMANVYRANDVVENRDVAVKILRNEFADSEEFQRRFRNESKAIAVLSHPNIVKIYDVGFTDKVQFIVMEYVDGITMADYIEQQGVLKWQDAVYFTMQMLKAKLYLLKQQENAEKVSGIRGEKKEMGWGNQIRSYVMQPYTMVKDHRTGAETGNVDSVLDGSIDLFMNAYLKWIALGEDEETIE